MFVECGLQYSSKDVFNLFIVIFVQSADTSLALVLSLSRLHPMYKIHVVNPLTAEGIYAFGQVQNSNI